MVFPAKPCARCKGSFVPSKSSDLYCSKECARAAFNASRRLGSSNVARGGEGAGSGLPSAPRVPSPGRPFTADTVPRPEPPPHPTDPDPLDDAFAAGRSLFRAFPNCEAVTIYRDAKVSMLRVGTPGESVADVLCDIGRAAGVTRKRPAPGAPSFEVT
jgi:hypothetical protein